MEREEIKKIIDSDCATFTFLHNGKQCGAEFETIDGKDVYQLWNGDFMKTFSNVDDLLSYKMFSGKNIVDASKKSKIEIY